MSKTREDWVEVLLESWEEMKPAFTSKITIVDESGNEVKIDSDGNLIIDDVTGDK